MTAIRDQRQLLRHRATTLHLPKGFVFGAATAAYQIEGAATADGKGESIWDRFCARPGVIADGSSGEVACDHYRRWPEDIDLMKSMNLGAYRFSLSWPRIQPRGTGAANRAGLAFYDRLIDGLLAEGIVPYVTLYHWDLPQALQEKGGWYSRETALRFADYASLAVRALGDRVTTWTTLNEPWTFCWSGHATGEDAPGLADGARGGVCASHHALLAHGLAVPVIRGESRKAKVGIVFDLNTVTPASPGAADEAAARRFDGAQNRWFLDAVFKGRYPEDMLDLYDTLLPTLADDDSRVIAAPIDYLGVNIYRRSVMKAGRELPPLNFSRVSPEGVYSAVGYEIYPPAIHDILQYVHANYAPPEIYVTENGLALSGERVESDGEIWDDLRAAYYVDHLEQVTKAIAEGVPVKGYFAWTLMDNFEWAYGYTTPFGLAHVDFASQARRLKFSGRIYGAIAAGVR